MTIFSWIKYRARLARSVEIQMLDMPLLDTRRDKDLLGTFIADLVLQVLSFVAHNERDNIRFGRRIKPLPGNFRENYDQWIKGKISGVEAAGSCG